MHTEVIAVQFLDAVFRRSNHPICAPLAVTTAAIHAIRAARKNASQYLFL
jgi:hypothetical protein